MPKVDLAGLERDLADARGQQDRQEKEAAAYAARRQAADRSTIALIIVVTFVVTIVALFAFVLTVSSTDDQWETRATFLMQLLSSVLLPVVTLVLGYYFGTQKKG